MGEDHEAHEGGGITATFRPGEAGDRDVSPLPGRLGSLGCRDTATARPAIGPAQRDPGEQMPPLPSSSVGLQGVGAASPTGQQRTKEPRLGAQPMESTDSSKRSMANKEFPARGSAGQLKSHLPASRDPAWFFPQERSVTVPSMGVSPWTIPGQTSEGWGQARLQLPDTWWDGEQDLETFGWFKLWLHFTDLPGLCTEVSLQGESILLPSKYR